jgi:hypothetical protein
LAGEEEIMIRTTVKPGRLPDDGRRTVALRARGNGTSD